MKRKTDEVMEFFTDMEHEDESFAAAGRELGPLASFLTDYEQLKGLAGLTQVEIARRMSTTQSAISRFESMKGKPTYELLRKASAAVNGALFLSPMADVSFTLPYDLHDAARNAAEKRGESIREMLEEFAREGIKREGFTVVQSNSVSTGKPFAGNGPVEVVFTAGQHFSRKITDAGQEGLAG